MFEQQQGKEDRWWSTIMGLLEASSFLSWLICIGSRKFLQEIHLLCCAYYLCRAWMDLLSTSVSPSFIICKDWRSFEVECARIVDNEFVHMGAGISEVHGNDSCLWNWRQDLLCCCCKKPSHLLLYEMIIRWSLMSRFENYLKRFKGCASWKLRFLDLNYTRACCNYLCLNSL